MTGRYALLGALVVPGALAWWLRARTPTTLAITGDGTELLRVGGVPRGPGLLEALRPHLP